MCGFVLCDMTGLTHGASALGWQLVLEFVVEHECTQLMEAE